MPAEDDVFDPQRVDGKLDGGCFATHAHPVRGHQVSGVAEAEQFAWLRLRDQVGYDPRVGTGDEQRFGLLPPFKLLEQLAAAGKDILLEVVEAMDEFLHRCGRGWLVGSGFWFAWVDLRLPYFGSKRTPAEWV